MGRLHGSRYRETSPHTRGERVRAGDEVPRCRNIPAYAGRTWDRTPSRDRTWKHPRIRGENPQVNLTSLAKEETSPHTRGELTSAQIDATGLGNIPAYAGRTIAICSSGMCCEKHPRIRGENLMPRSFTAGVRETSPHTRGEPKIGRQSRAT